MHLMMVILPIASVLSNIQKINFPTPYHNMTKILAVKYPQAQDRNVPGHSLTHLHRVLEVAESDIRKAIGELLFNISELYRYNYCLIKFNNKLFVIEASDYQNNTYSRKELINNWHPLSHYLN